MFGNTNVCENTCMFYGEASQI